MVLMMAGRVLLVCALCVLWCGLPGVAADGAGVVSDGSADEGLFLQWRAWLRKECAEEVSRRTGGSENASAVEECVHQGMESLRAVVDGRRRWRHQRYAVVAVEGVDNGTGSNGQSNDRPKGSSPSVQGLQEGSGLPGVVGGSLNPPAREDTLKLSGDAISPEGLKVNAGADPAKTTASQRPKEDSTAAGTRNDPPPGPSPPTSPKEENALLLSNLKGTKTDIKVEPKDQALPVGAQGLHNQEGQSPQGKEHQPTVEPKASDTPTERPLEGGEHAVDSQEEDRKNKVVAGRKQTGDGGHEVSNEKVLRVPVEPKVNLTEIEQEVTRTHAGEHLVEDAEAAEKEKQREQRADGQNEKNEKGPVTRKQQREQEENQLPHQQEQQEKQGTLPASPAGLETTQRSLSTVQPEGLHEEQQQNHSSYQNDFTNDKNIVRTNATANTDATYSSTAVSHTTSPLLLLLVFACAAAAAVVAA
ncbi:mucin-associated surface protein (MASP) [Trypanosoma cruzi Dm28c]|uniref:Mucin-associated surface protein (MASP) n=2 Tax=Trypanosoma cruzi TaxID=5693 RepID=V5A5E3_TRYCR|nr:mucin-associated surface protein (MASP) [Trypanosoma cruzi Dm28c]PBJ76504.1 mucin-associated surface protein [Trypanosoma cruzi cruzi]PWV01870.1 Mucin-associated surface protein (MASP) [Trypanosoma cruzi]